MREQFVNGTDPTHLCLYNQLLVQNRTLTKHQLNGDVDAYGREGCLLRLLLPSLVVSQLRFVDWRSY